MIAGLLFCRECSEGKHGNCDGTAWSNELDAPAPCTCPDPSHAKAEPTADYDAPVPNPSNVPPRWYDATWEAETEPEWRFGAPVPGTLMPCGCHLRRPDLEAVLCETHLADLNGTRVTAPGADS